MKCDELKQEENPIEWGLYYDKNEVDAAIAELKCELSDARDDARSSRNLINDKNEEIKELEDKVQQKDFFWDGCCFSKMGFKNTIDVANYVDSLKAENERLKAKLESVQATAYTESVDAGMRERKLKRALYKACANWAKSEQYTEATWHGDDHREELWANVQAKCIKKAEEYK